MKAGKLINSFFFFKVRCLQTELILGAAHWVSAVKSQIWHAGQCPRPYSTSPLETISTLVYAPKHRFGVPR